MPKRQPAHRRRPPPLLMAMPTTFARQLQLDLPKLKERLRVPPWLEFLFVEDRKGHAH
jgi:hypothetical protein